ncbi:hypothetical protein [uncultured Mucilaginibacter sp.]|uniref:hypothetical protein n=1 Tax=uncultured Mucilaginibacter sp. TaxID=797541 RepID=UPI0025F03980|nr:hypothetical protein [uncultured Mucilaginibacter sp.]
MTKTIFLSFAALFFVCLLSCGSSIISSHQVKEFEGKITYHEINKTSDGIINIDDTVTLFYSHGNWVKIHSSGNCIKDYYFEKEPLRLFLLNHSDSLYRLNLNSSMQSLQSFKVSDVMSKIFPRKCEAIDLCVRFEEKDSTTFTNVNYVISRGYLPVDRIHFAKWNLGFFNKFIDESGCFYLNFKSILFGSSHKNVLGIISYDIISASEEPVDPKMFEIDRNKIKSDNN